MRSSLTLSAALTGYVGLSSAHFILKYPESIGDRDSTADEDPCGGFKPDISEGSDQLVDVHVGGEAIALRLTHSRATWLFRATLDGNAEGGWQRLYPNVVQSGLGDFCLPEVTFPEDWAGERGVISVVSSAEDGQLFQCIAANFVEGSLDAPSSCTNSTISAYFTDDADLDALVDSDSDSGSGGDSTTGGESQSPTSSPDPESTGSDDSDGAAGVLQAWSKGGLASFVTVVTMFMFGGALMI